MLKDYIPNSTFTDQQQTSLFQLEDQSWWFQYRVSVILSLMKRFFLPDRTTIDIGGGNGYTTSVAQKAGFKTVLIEPSFIACQNAVQRGINEVACGTVTEDSILDSSIEQILLLDVLEHVKADSDFISLLHKKLRGGGFY